MDELLILPTTLTVISTYRCTAACVNCCFACSPIRTEEMSLQEMLTLIKRSLDAYTSIKIVVITGGECFLLGEKLREVIRFVKSKGLYSRVVTNGYWATSSAKAFDILSLLKEDGLTEVNFSTGDEHLQYVPLQRLIYGIKVALDLQLTVALNVETSKGCAFTLEKMLENDNFKDFLSPFKYEKPLMIVRGQWMPFTKESLEIMLENKEMEILPTNTERCTNIFSSLTISPNKHMFSCCGLPSANIGYLDLGKIETEREIIDAYETQFEDFLKIWIFTEGPYKILSFIAEIIGDIPEVKYNFHMCFYCACIFGNPRYLKVLQDNYRRVYDNVILKYFLIKKRLAYVYS